MTSESHREAESPPARQSPAARLVEVLLILLVFFIAAGDPPPNVNEPHYLGRLMHYWNPQWCAGDLFLQSQESQLVFVWTLGWITRWLSLPAAAWAGRLIAWTLLAWAWQRLSWRAAPRPLASVLSAALFVTLMEQAHMAGEWVVGGVEAKVFAYGFVILALRELVDGRWHRVWLLLGAATAFHPLVGGWSAVLCAGVAVWQIAAEKGDRSIFELRRYFVALSKSKNGPVPFFWLGGAVLALAGILPALLLTWNEPAEVVAEASRIYVFERLPHHLAILRVDDAAARLTRHGLLIAGLLAVTVVTGGSPVVRTAGGPPAATGRLVLFAWGAVVLALVGFVIELAFWNQPLLAARLQRYYWYRLTDFAAPMVVAICVTALIGAGIELRRGWGALALAAALAYTGWHLATTVRARALNPVPPADARMRDFPAWVDACEWIAEHTPEGALLLTPRLNQSFKWRAGRAEVVTRKDIPQDARSIVEWHRRLKDIYYEQDAAGDVVPIRSLSRLGTERVRELGLAYGADFVLTDRDRLLRLPRVYWNEEYVVYRIEQQSDSPGE